MFYKDKRSTHQQHITTYSHSTKPQHILSKTDRIVGRNAQFNNIVGDSKILFSIIDRITRHMIDKEVGDLNNTVNQLVLKTCT